jgi:hypothetical protein
MQTAYFGSSTAIQKADWDPTSGTMTVYFAKGGSSNVPGVSVQEFRAFAESRSAGQFFNENFKGRT